MHNKIKYIIILALISVLIAFCFIQVNDELRVNNADQIAIQPGNHNKHVISNNEIINEKMIENINEKINEKHDNLAVVLILDTSGSMAETDPKKLRETASNIFIDLLSSEDYIGIITFDNDVTTVQPLTKVEDYNNKVNMKNNLKPYIVAKGDTNYKEAFDEAASQLKILEDDNSCKAILLITDGEPDPDSTRTYESGFLEAYMETLWKSVDNLVVNNYPVYSVGFSDGIRSDILDKISKDTGGYLQILKDSGSLASGFLHILGELKIQTNFIHETMDLSKNSSLMFSIDEAISPITIVLIDEYESTYEIELLNSQGEISNETFNIEKYDNYTILKCNLDKVVECGNWKLNIKGSGKVQVLGYKDIMYISNKEQRNQTEKDQTEKDQTEKDQTEKGQTDNKIQPQLKDEVFQLDNNNEALKSLSIGSVNRTSIVQTIKFLFLLALILFIAFIIIGQVMYCIFDNSRKAIKGVLIYHLKNKDPSVEPGETFSIPSVNKKKFIISFNENNTYADFYVVGTIFDYDIIITLDIKPTKLSFIEGWKELFHKASPLNYKLVTTVPGIIEKDGRIFTHIILKDNEEFESGGYIFRYLMPLSIRSKNAAAGRNILEGKYGESDN